MLASLTAEARYSCERLGPSFAPSVLGQHVQSLHDLVEIALSYTRRAASETAGSSSCMSQEIWRTRCEDVPLLLAMLFAVSAYPIRM